MNLYFPKCNLILLRKTPTPVHRDVMDGPEPGSASDTKQSLFSEKS
jgi:hypothetical protein